MNPDTKLIAEEAMRSLSLSPAQGHLIYKSVYRRTVPLWSRPTSRCRFYRGGPPLSRGGGGGGILNVSSDKRRVGRDADMVYDNLHYGTGLRLHLTLLFKPLKNEADLLT